MRIELHLMICFLFVSIFLFHLLCNFSHSYRYARFPRITDFYFLKNKPSNKKFENHLSPGLSWGELLVCQYPRNLGCEFTNYNSVSVDIMIHFRILLVWLPIYTAQY